MRRLVPLQVEPHVRITYIAIVTRVLASLRGHLRHFGLFRGKI